MSFYIVCQKKRNNPRMDIRICEKKCELKDECEEFQAYKRSKTKEVNLQYNAEPQAAQLSV
ncbi:MAG: hypothetical protein JW944_01385 [Deltaproteobacteria bacterium]|nr:hypothetical protein [Deltaproteobacteria bacterium]